MMASGSTHDAALFTSASDGRVSALTEFLESEVSLVHPEKRFEVHVFDHSRFREDRDWKCLVLLVDLRDPGVWSGTVKNLLTSAECSSLEREPAGYRVVIDPWAASQTVLLVHARDAAALRSLLAEKGPRLLADLEDGIETALESALLAGGENADLSRHLDRRFGFHLRIPKDYVLAENEAGDLVRLYRIMDGQPPRFLFVHWQPAASAPRTGERMLAVRDSLARIYYDGDRILPDRCWTEEGTFQGEDATILHGVWVNETYSVGGPFRSFAFFREGRFFLLDTSVFNPAGDKLPALREVGALARTFRIQGRESREARFSRGAGQPRRRG